MNSLQIDFDLSISALEAISLLTKIMKDPENEIFDSKRFQGQIIGNEFQIMVKRSLIWGNAFRNEIKGQGSIIDNSLGSHLRARFELCSPSKHVNLNARKLSVLLPVFAMSWVGLIFAMIYHDAIFFLDLLLLPVFFITCSALLVGLHKYLFVSSRIKDIRNSFDATYGKHIINRS